MSGARRFHKVSNILKGTSNCEHKNLHAGNVTKLGCGKCQDLERSSWTTNGL